jgi:hypothetical protein
MLCLNNETENLEASWYTIQGDSGENVDTLGGYKIGHCDKKKFHMNLCVILNGCRDRAVWISRPNSVRFFFVGLDEERSIQKKVDTRDELLARSLDAAARIKKREDQLGRTARGLRTRFAK